MQLSLYTVIYGCKSKQSLQEKLTRLVAERLGKPDLARSTVTGVLKHSDKWLKVPQTSASKTVKHRGPQNEKLELALIEWFGNVRARGGSSVDRLIVEKAKMSDAPEVTDMADDADSSDDVEEIVTAPSLTLMRQQLKGFATFMADNPQFSAADELVLQRFSDKVAKMLVSRVNYRRQQSITSFFSAANALV